MKSLSWFKLELNASQILSCIDRLGIKRESQPNHKGWLLILCPNPAHHDKNMKNCAVNVNTSVVSCFVCAYKKNLYGVVKDNLNVSFSEAKEFIENTTKYVTTVNNYIPNDESNTVKFDGKKVEELMLVDFDPEYYKYTKDRGFTKEFCKQFHISLCCSKPYVDYMIIPVWDKLTNVVSYEARKLKRYENLNKFFETKDMHQGILNRYFNDYVRKNNIIRDKKTGKLFSNDIEIFDEILNYLMRPKVLYPINSKIQDTLFNLDNLDFEKDLILIEGTGGISKIYNYISKNVTCFFGVKLSENQIKLLQRFKKIIHIPDFDKAGYLSVDKLNKELTKKLVHYAVLDVRSEDTDESYIDDIINTKEMSPLDYTFKYYKTYN